MYPNYVTIICCVSLDLGSLRNFSEEELDFATRSFSQLVGKGSFGCVYKGVMQHIPVAVKVMDPVRWLNRYYYCYNIHVHVHTFSSESTAGHQPHNICDRSASSYKVSLCLFYVALYKSIPTHLQVPTSKPN